MDEKLCCPDVAACGDARCRMEGVCCNGDYWAGYWRRQGKLQDFERKMARLFTRPVAVIDVKPTRCCYCNRMMYQLHELTFEHLVPVSKGGSDRPDNLRLCCQECNTARGNTHLRVWISEMQKEITYRRGRAIVGVLKARIKNARFLDAYIRRKGRALYAATAAGQGFPLRTRSSLKKERIIKNKYL